MLKTNQLSYWERECYTTNNDFIVVGAGIVGYSCALELKKKHPLSKVTILERGYLPTGASSKNAGFACFGSATELADDLSQQNESEVWETVAMRWEGLKNLIELVGIESLDLQINGSWDLITSEDQLEFEKCEKLIPYLNENIQKITKEKSVYSIDQNVASSFGFNKIETSFKNRLEGQINTGLMVKKLHQLCIEADINCLFGIEVQSFKDSDSGIHISTNFGEFLCSKLAICTNGFAKQLLPEEDIQPARAQVLITKPIPDLSLKGTFHYQKGYYYFRNIHNRILFGGGRNLDFKGETTTSFEQSELIKENLTKILSEVILPNKSYEIDYFWSGIMGVGKTKKPIIKKITNNTTIGVRMGGMGVAIGSLVGKQVAASFT
jgi:gamma-glutamylputrescine oxidase